jgi:hypothetical protein
MSLLLDQLRTKRLTRHYRRWLLALAPSAGAH